MVRFRAMRPPRAFVRWWVRSRKQEIGGYQGDRQGRPIRINLRTIPSTSVGARAADEGLGGPLWSPAGWSGVVFLSSRHIWNKGDREGPHPTSAPPLPLQRTSLGRRFTRSHCKGGSGADVGWGPSRSPCWFLLRRSSTILMKFRDTPSLHKEKVSCFPPRFSSRVTLYLECTSA